MRRETDRHIVAVTLKRAQLRGRRAAGAGEGGETTAVHHGQPGEPSQIIDNLGLEKRVNITERQIPV